MINLMEITEEDVRIKIKSYLKKDSSNQDQLRILNSALRLSNYFSFTNNRTYPRPDHPDVNKRKPLIFMMVAILVSLRTTLENEQKAMNNLISKFPTSDKLFLADVKSIEECIRPAGMATKKARTIVQALKYVEINFSGELEVLSHLETDEARFEIMKLPGFGPKATDCLLSIGLGKPTIAVDVNVFRVTSWLFNLPWASKPNYSDKSQILEVKKLLDASIPKDVFLCQIIHTYFLLFGKSVGPQHSHFKSCLLQEYCLTCQNNSNLQSNMPLLFDSIIE